MTGCPMVEESPVNLECRVKEIKALGSHDLFLAEVVAVHVSEAIWKERPFPPEPDGTGGLFPRRIFQLGKSLRTFSYSAKKPAKEKGKTAQIS